MTLTRRQLLGGAAALSAAGRGFPAFAAAPTALVARPGRHRLAGPDQPPAEIWGYDGTVPGPVIRVRQGERLLRHFENRLEQPSTVHWHGIRIDNAMDGVPDLTQPAVAPGETFAYDFTVPDAGTYWYHPHNRAWEQMARGLYGALIVEEAEPPKVDRDEVLLIDDWRLDDGGQIHESFGAMMDWSHAGRIGNWLTANGDGFYRLGVRRSERLRLRLVNTANASILPLAIRGMRAWVVALDGQPVDRPYETTEMRLAPAQRVDLIADITADEGTDARLAYASSNGEFDVATFPIVGTARAEWLPDPSPLPANPVRSPETPLEVKPVELRMEGGAMSAMRRAMMGGRMMDMRGLMEARRFWSFNGLAEMPDEPLTEADLGETVVVRMINDTPWPHAMHLHGHHFRRIGEGGTMGPLRDTLLMDADETADIAFVADNPGDWLLHCHMLEHSAAGMMTWLRVKS